MKQHTECRDASCHFPVRREMNFNQLKPLHIIVAVIRHFWSIEHSITTNESITGGQSAVFRLVAHAGSIVASPPVPQSLQLHLIEKILRSTMFLDCSAWTKQPVIWIKFDMMLFMIDSQAIVNSAVGRCLISVERTLVVMGYPMRHEAPV